MIKNIGKVLPLALAASLTVTSLTGCGANTKKIVSVKTPDYTTEKTIESNIEETTTVTPVITPVISEQPTIITLTPIESEPQEPIVEVKEKTVEDLYKELSETGITSDVIDNELENIAILGSYNIQEFRTFKRLLYPNLGSTLNEDESIYDKYYDLAIKKHMLTCKDEHTCENGYYYCNSIDKKIDEINDTVLFTGVFVEEALSTDEPEYSKMMYRLYKNEDVDLVKAISQLENVYIARQIPMCMNEEDWCRCFSELLKTCTEYENVCELYGPLAELCHIYRCDDEHYENEFGVLSCETAMKRVLGK